MSEKEKPKITKLVVGRGSTRKIAGTENFDKTYYQIEFEFPERPRADEFEQARKAGLETIEAWLGEKIEPTTAKPLDPAELEKLPWKPYKEGHRAGWVFTDKAEQLADLIRHSETGKVQIGEFEYKFSGPEENRMMFISRTPIKPEQTEPPKQ